MCITTGPASLSSTILLAHNFTHNGKDVNVLGYKNTAESRGPCAMLLPIPSTADMSAENCINLSACPGIFQMYAELVLPQRLGNSRGGDFLSFGGVQVFDSGSYTVLLARRASDLVSVLDQVPAAKRPEANSALYRAMDDLYPDFWFALCCWKGSVDAEPLLWWYEPLPAYTTHHFLPALDAHDGGAPKLDEYVDVDHTLVIGVAEESSQGVPADDVRSHAPTELQQFLPTRVGGTQIRDEQRNGDWRIPKGNFTFRDFERVPPPGV